jgi:uncharacterized membrane protein YbhN (UPF0104 family)
VEDAAISDVGDSDRGLSARLVRLAEHRHLHGVVAKVVTGLAIVGVIVGVWLAVAKLPKLEHPVRPALLAAAVGLAVLSFLNNGIEYWWISRRVGIDIGPLTATRVSIKATAANALPIPGAALVKFEALHRSGARARHSVALITGATVMVIGVSFAFTGVLAFAADVENARGIAFLVFVLGAVAMGLAGFLVWKAGGRSVGSIGVVTLIETGSVLLAGFRMALIVAGLGYHVSLTQAFAVSLAGQISIVMGITPGGLGVREGLAAVFGRLTGQVASISIVGSAIDRVVTYTALGLLAAVVFGASRMGWGEGVSAPAMAADRALEPSDGVGPVP